MSFRLERLKARLRRSVLPSVFFKLARSAEWGTRRASVQSDVSALAGVTRVPCALQRDQGIHAGNSRSELDAVFSGQTGAYGRRRFSGSGVYRGGTARRLRHVVDGARSSRRLYLFDTFGGMPSTRKGLDLHRSGDFSDTSLGAVSDFVGKEDGIVYRRGLIPATAKSPLVSIDSAQSQDAGGRHSGRAEASHRIFLRLGVRQSVAKEGEWTE